ncbi:MAG: FctA domain-containing protein, partial [Clostridia bacterium]|nr:FctA domain-containing protein [Clostridia bacterium]
LTDAGKTYTYTITEDDTTLGGITKDAKTKTVKVKITDNGDGTLKTEIVEGSDTIAFTNNYAATGSITFEGAKALTGRSLTEDDVFTFTVKEDGFSLPVATGSSDETGTITFDTIEYNLGNIGTHTYLITEDDTSIAAVTKDNASKKVVVSVTDNGDGTLKAEIVEKESDDIAFTNTYTATGSITFTGSKTINGRDMTANDKFTFTVKEGDKTVATGENKGTGTITFTTISYTLDDLGEHSYTVTEDDTSISGITKDAAALTVIVNVTDNGDGTLKAEISQSSPAIAFTNTYGAAGSITLQGTKSLTGRALNADDKFTFAVKEGTTVRATGTNDETGKITFSAIPYTIKDLGPHYYTVTEDDTLLGGMTKDDAVLNVMVYVTDNGNGTLKAEIVKSESDDITFSNTYEAKGDITFT